MIKVGDLVQNAIGKGDTVDVGIVIDISESSIFEDDKLITVLSSRKSKQVVTTLSGVKKVNP
tara:strand:- start:5110 stop:5295 length:186 start_codon:yes stop_codon:yes gene_type:complete